MPSPEVQSVSFPLAWRSEQMVDWLILHGLTPSRDPRRVGNRIHWKITSPARYDSFTTRVESNNIQLIIGLSEPP